jgi:tetraacyldisaccharide 4'-kinase
LSILSAQRSRLTLQRRPGYNGVRSTVRPGKRKWISVPGPEPHPVPTPRPSRTDALRQWYWGLVSGRRRGPDATGLRLILWVLSLGYGLAVRLRNLLYHLGWLSVERVPVPVVSVGNLTAGGTGKTPMVEYVAGFYRRLEYRVAILSRGYGATGGSNDEARVLYDNLPDVPHLQGADRVALARTALEELESEILILDDGFQHRRLARDLDLVLIDATAPWGYGYLLPRGLLREPPGSLRRAHLVLLTRCDLVAPDQLEQLRRRVARLAPGLPVVETCHQPVELVNAEGTTAPVELLGQRPVAAFCGLGNPEAFRRTLEQAGATLCAFRTFPDHHAYCREDVEELVRWTAGLPVAGPVVATTQKDLVKLRLTQLGPAPLWALRIRLRVLHGQEALDRLLRRGAAIPSQQEREAGSR